MKQAPPLMDPLWDDLAPPEPKPTGDPDCVACDGYKWYAEAARWRRLWWDADTEAKVYLWLICQMVLAADEEFRAALDLRRYWVEQGYGMPERTVA